MPSLPLGAPCFKPGDAVRIDSRAVAGHCRTPAYLRGKLGIVTEILGRFRDPERLAYHRPGLPAHVLYKVRFTQNEVWGSSYVGPISDHLEADIFETWLTKPVSDA